MPTEHLQVLQPQKQAHRVTSRALQIDVADQVLGLGKTIPGG